MPKSTHNRRSGSKRITKGLPPRWCIRYNRYWYRPKKSELQYWDNKTEFPLAVVPFLSEAHKIFANRVALYEPGAVSLNLFRDLITRYRGEVTPTKAERTQSDEHPRLFYLDGLIGTQMVGAMRTPNVYQLYDAITKKRGLTTANHCMGTLSHLLTMAIRWGALTDHPMTDGKFVKTKPEVKLRYVEDWEIDCLLSVASPMIKAYTLLKWTTGIRQTDLLQMTWAQVEEGYIRVTPSKTAKKTGGKTIRIEVTPTIRAILDYHRTHQQKEIIASLVFCTTYGRSYLDKNKRAGQFYVIWRRYMKKAVAETELQIEFKEREIRLKTGSDMPSDKDAQKLLGHTTEAMTRKSYRALGNTVTPLHLPGDQISKLKGDKS